LLLEVTIFEQEFFVVPEELISFLSDLVELFLDLKNLLLEGFLIVLFPLSASDGTLSILESLSGFFILYRVI